ncbi:hypothetical protein Tco_0489179 [Tanacetum coccineum]
MGDANPIRTLEDYYKPSSKCYRNTFELPVGNNVGESLLESWTRFKDLLQKVPHHGIDLWLKDLALYNNESWNDPRNFAKPVKAISLPQDVPSTSDHRLIELENQVQRLMEAHHALIKSLLHVRSAMVPTTLSTAWKIPNKPFLKIHPHVPTKREVSGTLRDTYNPSWKSHPNLRSEEDKRRGVEYVMSKILEFYKECLELGPEYVTRMDDEGEVTQGRVTSRSFSKKTKRKFCAEPGDYVRIPPDGVVIFDKKNAGSLRNVYWMTLWSEFSFLNHDIRMFLLIIKTKQGKIEY